jgi:folate-dependent tRNA-U54 methylase TrmFO/GidA
MAMSPRDDSLKVNGLQNLFCAGEKAGLLVGHTEAICTGTLAGYNSVRYVKKEDPLILPESLAIGDAIKYVRDRMMNHNELDKKITFSGSVYFDRMKQMDLYTTDIKDIEKKVEAAGMADIFK